MPPAGLVASAGAFPPYSRRGVLLWCGVPRYGYAVGSGALLVC